MYWMKFKTLVANPPPPPPPTTTKYNKNKNTQTKTQIKNKQTNKIHKTWGNKIKINKTFF